jgi:hypothetical protein
MLMWKCLAMWRRPSTAPTAWPIAAQRTARPLHAGWNARQLLFGGAQQLGAFAGALFGEQRVFADHQAFARIVGAGDLGHVAVIEQRGLQRPAFAAGSSRRATIRASARSRRRAARQDGVERDAARGAERGQHVAMRQRADDFHRLGGGQQLVTTQHGAELLDALSGSARQVGEGSVFGLARLAVALPQQDGRRRASVGDNGHITCAVNDQEATNC